MCRKLCYLQCGCRGYPPASGFGRKAVAGCVGSKVEHATGSCGAAQGTPSQNNLSRLPGSDFMYAASPQQQQRQPRLPGGMRRQSSLQPSEVEMDDAPQVRQCSTSPAHQAWYPTPEGMPSLLPIWPSNCWRSPPGLSSGGHRQTPPLCHSCCLVHLRQSQCFILTSTTGSAGVWVLLSCPVCGLCALPAHSQSVSKPSDLEVLAARCLSGQQ